MITQEKVIKIRAAIKLHESMQDSDFKEYFTDEWIQEELNKIIGEGNESI